MSRLDVVIFGATGFTGKHAVSEMVRISKQHNVSWGIAGRSQSKLETLIQHVAEDTGEDQSHVKIIIAEVSDEKSLKDMCLQAKVIANCCGPYRLYGEPVVRAAIEAKTHHVDVSGEPQFIESMQLKYSQQAAEAGVYVISACGYDSIPNDLGTVFLQQQFGAGTLNSVESYMSSSLPAEYRMEAMKRGAIHYGTWESLVHSLAHYDELKPLRQKLYPERLPALQPKLKKRGLLHKRDGAWCVPFPGADNSIVYRTQRTLNAAGGVRPAQFRCYMKFGSLVAAVGVILWAALVYAMARMSSYTRGLLLRHPRVFSGGLVSRAGPPPECARHTRYAVTLHGEGWATSITPTTDKQLVARVTGLNPGYGATVCALLYSALTVLQESDKMPDKGGVLTTGYAFRNTSIIKHLNENNMKFQIVDVKDESI